MNDKEINEIVEKKLLEAKLQIAESKFHFLLYLAGGLLTLFGITYPFLFKLYINKSN